MRVYIEMAVVAVLIILIAAMLVIYFSFRETGAAPKFFGYYIYQTHATNMETKVPSGSAIFAREVPLDEIDAGDVILCRIDGDLAIIRVVEVLAEDSGKFFIVRYDTAPANDTYKIPAESIVARAAYYDVFIGKLLDFATSEKGIIIVVIIPSILIVLFQVVKIVLAQKEEYDSDDEDEEGEEFGGRYASLGKHLTETDEEPLHELPPVRAKFDTSIDEKEEKVLKIGSDGTAVYEPKPKAASVLVTEERLDRMSGKVAEKDSPLADSFVNEPVKIPENRTAADPIAELLGSSLGERSRSAFGNSNVIPEELAAVRTFASPPEDISESRSGKHPFRKAEESPSEETAPREFFSIAAEEAAIPPGPEDKTFMNTNSIPENSVIPRETIAPKRKVNNKKTVEELMSMIDAEQARIKKNR